MDQESRKAGKELKNWDSKSFFLLSCFPDPSFLFS